MPADKPLIIPPRRALSDEVYKVVLGMLMDQQLEPGSRINIDAVARELGVSPTPVREALTRLESEGLVTKQALKGYTAGNLLDENGLRDLFDVRGLLEPYGARHAAEIISASALARMEQLCATMRELAAKPSSNAEARFQDYKDFAAADAEFHQLVAEESGNSLVAEALARLHSHIHLYRLYYQQGLASNTVGEHELVVEALRSHDPDAAEAAMLAHITQSHERLATSVTPHP